MRKIFAPEANIFIGKTVHFVKVEENERGGTFQRTEGALGFIFNSNLAPPPSLYKTLPAIISPSPPPKK